jgi:Ran GTPase-activating protein (RanGAP) involved in mRNA processing and transport
LVDNDLKIIIEYGMINSKCTTLDLSGNNITAAGATLIASAFEFAPNLRRLNLSNNDIGDAGAHDIAVALGNTNLTHLILNRTCIKNQGAMDLAKNLCQNRTLTHLMVTGNLITGFGLYSLQTAAACHPSIRHVFIEEDSYSYS